MENPPTDLLPFAKALLLVALAAWFAGTFHLVRLFIAHRNAMARWEPDRTVLHDTFKAMERRAMLWTNWPMLVAAAVLGAWCVWMHPAYVKEPYVHVLLGTGAVLVLYHLVLHRLFRSSAKGETRPSLFVLHLLAQGPTVLLCAMVAVVVLRDRLGWAAGSMGLLAIGGIAAYGIASARKSKPVSGDA